MASDETSSNPATPHKCPRSLCSDCATCITCRLQKGCCAVHRCLRDQVRTIAQAKALINTYDRMRSQQGRQKFFQDAARLAKEYNCGGGKVVLRLPFRVRHNETVYLCARAAAHLFGASLTTVWRAIDRVKQGHWEPSPCIPRVRMPSPGFAMMQAWLKRHFETNADKSPTKEGVLSMPLNVTVSSLHLEFKAAMQAKNFRPILSSSCMSRIISSHFSHVRFPKDTALGTCDECATFRADLLKTSLSQQRREALQAELYQHRANAAQERLQYAERQELAKPKNPDVLSCAFDGAAAVSFPCTWPPSKQEARHNMQVPLYGLKWHNWSRPVLAFSPPAFTHNVNFVITFFANELAKLFEAAKKNPNLYGKDFNPRTLYIQCDNTTRENKNKYLFHFLALLVKNKYFDTIELNMLPVGHTHIDIDGIFGMLRTGRKVVENNCFTLPEYMASISDPKKRVTPLVAKEDVGVLGGVWNFAAVLGEEDIVNITRYRAFRFQRINDSVHINYRENCLPTTPWCCTFNLDDPKCAPKINTLPPLGKPVLASQQPTKSKPDSWWNDLNRIPYLLGGKINLEQLKWWKAWTQKPTNPPHKSSPYNEPPDACLQLFNLSSLSEKPIPPSLDQSSPLPPLPPLLVKPNPSWRLKANASPSPLLRDHDPTIFLEPQEDDIILMKGDRPKPLWLAKITSIIGKRAGSAVFDIKVTWYDGDDQGKWTLRETPSSTTQVYPTQVLLCHLCLNSDGKLPAALEELCKLAAQREAHKAHELDSDE